MEKRAWRTTGLGESPIEDEEADRGDLIINSNTRPRGRLEYRNRLKKSRNLVLLI